MSGLVVGTGAGVVFLRRHAKASAKGREDVKTGAVVCEEGGSLMAGAWVVTDRPGGALLEEDPQPFGDFPWRLESPE